jgi:hypothetical protein
MAVALKQKVLFSSTASSANSAFTTTADILPGEDVFIGLGRNALSTTTNGMLNITTSAGAGTFERVATSCRSGTFDMQLGRLRCTTLIPSGSTITAVGRSASAKRGGVLQVVSGLTSAAAHKSSGNAADNTAGNVSGGVHGSSTSESGSTPATTVADTFVLSVLSYGGTGAYAVTNGTEIDKTRTTSGTADRGAILAYKIESTTGAKTIAASQPTGGWAVGIAAFEIDTTPPPAAEPAFYERIGGVWTPLTVKEKVGGVWTTVNVVEVG